MSVAVQNYSLPRQTTHRRSGRNPMETLSHRDVAESSEETTTHKENSVYLKESKGNSSVRARDSTDAEANGGTLRLTSFLVKLIILLLVLSGIGGIGSGIYSMISYSTSREVLSSIDPASEYQVAELEGFVKKTSKMLRAQIELVDKKYAEEVKGVKKELHEKIQEHASKLSVELHNIRKYTDGMKETLKQLEDDGVFTTNDVQQIVNEMSKTREPIGEGQAWSLDDVRSIAKQLVEAELERHSADGLGMVDFAATSYGSKVVKHSKGYNYGRNFRCSLFKNFGRSGSLHPYVSKMLEPSFGELGQCLPLKGSKVFVDIALSTSIFVNAVTLEHVAKSVAYDRSNAPKDFRIFGRLSQSKKNPNKEEAHQMFLLGEFTYDLDNKNVQTFNLPLQSTRKLVNIIKLDVLSNHGSHSHTCIYRLRVHGLESTHDIIK